MARAALEWLGGRPVLNSVNLEEGDGDGHPARHLPAAGPGVRRRRGLHLHRRGGPGPHGRVEAPRRPGHPRHRRRTATASSPRDLLFDPLALPAVDRHGGEPARRHRDASRGSAGSRPSCPACRTILGLSNVSFGLNPAARQVLNSVFLHECVEAGLDAAIVHASKILPALADRRAGPRGLPRPRLRPPRATATTRSQELLAALRGRHGAGARRPRTTSTGRSSGASSSGSSTATATGWRPTSTRPWPPGTPRWTS